MRVIPVQPRVSELEFINELLASSNFGLRNTWHSVHLDRSSDTVPVDCGRLRQLVPEVHTKAITHPRSNEWSRNAAVERPRLDLRAIDFDQALSGVEIDLDDARVRITVGASRSLMLASHCAGASEERACGWTTVGLIQPDSATIARSFLENGNSL